MISKYAFSAGLSLLSFSLPFSLCLAGEPTLPVGCPGLDLVSLSVSPFPGATPPDSLPEEPFVVDYGEPFGIVVEVGELGNNEDVLLLVTLDDNTINGDPGDLVGLMFFPEPGEYVFLADAKNEVSGPYYAVATLISSESSRMGCENVNQVYNTQVTISFVAPCDGDANHDGTVDPLDAGYVLSRVNCAVGTGDIDCDRADVNSDGSVDPLDVGYVLSRVGDCG